jgi:hypothetical protein
MKFPRADAELTVWFKHFADRLDAHATALGLDESVVEGVRRDAAALGYAVGELVPAYLTALHARTAYKRALLDGPVGPSPLALPPAPPAGTPPQPVPPGILPRTRRLIARIKAAPGYHEAVGRDLGIAGPGASALRPASAGEARPSAKATALSGGEVRVEFNKAGYDGVLVESRRGDRQNWERLGVDSYSPYTDARPPLVPGQPELREYRLRYIKRDEPTGEWSDILTATVTP